jgi:hypothetical protein
MQTCDVGNALLLGVSTQLLKSAPLKYNVKVTPSPSMQLSNGSLISALGGALSLYLGISIAMFFEVIEIIIDFLINIANDGNKKNVKKTKK